MRKNEYESLDEFIYEYSSGKSFAWQSPDYKPRFMGIEFMYRGTYYRMCREPFIEGSNPILDDGKFGLYDVMIIHCETKGYPCVDSCELIGWYASLEDVLEKCIIKGEKFRNIIIDDNTEILGKD